jgi:AcrR family transcriptional regulator
MSTARATAAAGATPPEGRVARRRAQVRQRILAVAERLIAARGVDGVTIDEIAEAADIARRSFYHHFETKHDVLVPITHARTQALTRRIDHLLTHIADPAEVMATAMRHAFREIGADPMCRWFIQHSGLPQERLYAGMDESGMRDALRAVEAGRFHVDNPAVLRLLVSGAFVTTITARIAGTLTDRDLDDAVEHLLRLFGLSVAEARTIAHLPLPRLPDDPGATRRRAPSKRARTRRTPTQRTEK